MASGKPVDGFGPYRVVRQIGSGGMAGIFEAVDARLGRRVALKRLHPHVADRPGAAERFLREGHAAARIRHPHVVQVFDLGTEDAGPYLAMELLEGSDLGATIAREGHLSVEASLELLLPVMAAVAAAHDARVIHRDLKPSNVFVSLDSGGRPWTTVLDFGVSKVLVDDDAGSLTATDGVLGTAAYMAPEQARAARNASFLSDQYSLAVILFQCLTGALPFSAAGVYELFQAIMTAPLSAPSRHAEGIPPELDAVVMHAMSRDPGGRFPSVRAFGAALLPFARERDRVLWSAELYEGAAPPHSPRPPRPAPAASPAREAAPPSLTMPATAQDTRVSLRRRALRPMVAGLLAAASIAGAGAWARWRVVRATPPKLDPSSLAVTGAPADPSAAPALGAPTKSAAAVASGPASTGRARAPAPMPPGTWPSAPPRRWPGVPASASTARAPSTAAPSLSIGDNGAPILPP